MTRNAVKTAPARAAVDAELAGEHVDRVVVLPSPKHAVSFASFEYPMFASFGVVLAGSDRGAGENRRHFRALTYRWCCGDSRIRSPSAQAIMNPPGRRYTDLPM